MKQMNSEELNALAHHLLDEATKILADVYPDIKRLVTEAVEVVFVPRAVARQIGLALALEVGVVTVRQVLAIVENVHSNFSSRSRLIRQLSEKQKNADTQDEWMDLAEQIDNIQGHDVWRTEVTCPLYESDRISARIDEFVHLMRRRDVFDLMFTLRGGIARNKFGLLHEGLFSRALAGTKVLVETYHNIVCTALDFVCDSESIDEDIPVEAKLSFFNETRHMYGRTALMLSGGAALGFYHIGVVKALMKNGLLPRVISGASAGSIVCAMIATRTDYECTEDLFNAKGTDAPGHSGKIMTNFFRPLKPTAEKKERFKENAFKEVMQNTAGAFSDGKKTWQLFFPIGVRNITSNIYDVLTGHRRAKDILLSDTEHFRECCKANIGNFTFQEAFDRTGRILNIIVSPQNRSDPPRLLNYLTSPHVLVWSAAVASSSLPGVFEPNKLLVKNTDGTERSESATQASFIDGSM
jgi:TAG lipase/steryl ester hydrolase/phospholipase A2/LPA acyltransferase